MSEQIKISVIIPFYNEIKWLEMIFIGLKKQSLPHFEVIIADDGSREEIVKQVKQAIPLQPFPVTHLWQEDLGFRKNKMLNKAIVESKGEYLIFLDGDCIPHSRFVEEHNKYKKKGRVISGRRVDLTEKICQYLTPEKVASKSFERSLYLPLFYAGITGIERHVENCIRITNKTLRSWFIKGRNEGILGCNFSIFKSDILKVNGFDERFIHPGTGEDTDLEERLRRVGITPVVANHVLTVYHKKHKRLDVHNEPNSILYKENNANNVSFTPYGINQSK